jgi:hypothetical protein
LRQRIPAFLSADPGNYDVLKIFPEFSEFLQVNKQRLMSAKVIDNILNASHFICPNALFEVVSAPQRTDHMVNYQDRTFFPRCLRISPIASQSKKFSPQLKQ